MSAESESARHRSNYPVCGKQKAPRSESAAPSAASRRHTVLVLRVRPVYRYSSILLILDAKMLLGVNEISDKIAK
eukprot:6188925-Pleurochrysis_carterae.AAC.3